MNTYIDSICYTEQLNFLKYVNEYYLFYTITIFTFIALFSLARILKNYTYFEKNKIPRAKIPTVPYGNFGDVIKQETSLHVFLWKHYNRFKRKGCKYGGLFLFMKPTILLVDSDIVSKINQNTETFINIFPCQSKLERKDINKTLTEDVINGFVEKYNYTLKGTLSEKLLKNEMSSVLKDVLLDSICLAFGFQSFEMVEEINHILKERYDTSLRYYLSFCFPLLRKKQHKLNFDFKEHLLEIIENRKKIDLRENDLIQSFIELYNESNYKMEDVIDELFTIFVDTLTYSYSTVVLCLNELANNLEIQEDVIGEVRRYNSKNRKITYENLLELPYLDAVIKETLRKYPPIATIIKSNVATVGKTALEPYSEKNGLIFQSVLGVHRDPQYYTKPEAFDPDRFLEIQRFTNTFMPFGLGARSHLYMKFTSLQVTLILLSIFSCLEVKMKDGVSNALKYNAKLLYLSPCEDLSLQFVRLQ